MDRRKILYKNNVSTLSPRKQRQNRERLAIRTKERNDQFQASRKISLSPSSRMLKAPPCEKASVLDDNKENVLIGPAAPHLLVGSYPVASRIAQVACKTDAQKLTRQETFLQRFIEWKEAKKQQEAIKKHDRLEQKKPFVPAGVAALATSRMAGSATTSLSSLVPKNHVFKAPDGLKNPGIEKKTHFSRKSFYTVVATPPKKKQGEKEDLKKFPVARKALPANHITPGRSLTSSNAKKHSNTVNKNTQEAPTNLMTYPPTDGTPNKPTALLASDGQKTTNIVSKKTPGPSVTIAANQRFNGKTPGPPIGLNQKSAAKPAVNAVAAVINVTGHRFQKPRPLILPPHPPTRNPSARIVKPTQSNDEGIVNASGEKRGGGAVGKAKALQSNKQLRAAAMSKKPNLSVCMKAKKGAMGSTAAKMSKQHPGKFNLNKKTLLEVPHKSVAIAETPTDLTNINPFGLFVTSTKRKSTSNAQNMIQFITDATTCDTISPVDAMVVEEMPKRNSSAKRTLLQDNGAKVLKAQPHKSAHKREKSKFNFVRYSEANSEMLLEKTLQLEKDVIVDKRIVDSKSDEEKKYNEELISNNVQEKTPTKDENGERPINYLSPYVSVARGKVNSKKENEKRNSIYLQSIAPQTEIQSLTLQEKEQEESAVVLRRNLETVRYFRKQLLNETSRLHALCDKWEVYKSETNLPRLKESGGDDMINVTIGQTKLLTSKKFMQFSGLIDRFEKSATLRDNIIDDGSEDSKPITAIDLEGFWSMVRLQVENVEKRFENLERWQTHDWIDPDEVAKPKAEKSKVTKVRKPKAAAPTAKPNSALQQMLRKMHADMRKNKEAAAVAAAAANNNCDGNIIITTPRKRRSQSGGNTPQRHSTPRRGSIIVKGRKMHSPAPTILTIHTTKRRSLLAQKPTNVQSPKESPKLLRNINEFRKSFTNLQKTERNELWFTALKGADQQRLTSIAAPPNTPPSCRTPTSLIKSRKSILKTPGTAKGKPKNVIFNEELQIKKFKFTIDSDQSADEDLEEAKLLENNDETDDSDKRTYSLRTRKVVLRPSSEFEIPIK